MLQVWGHPIFSDILNKISLSPFCDKIWIKDDGISMLSHGHKDIPKKLKE